MWIPFLVDWVAGGSWLCSPTSFVMITVWSLRSKKRNLAGHEPWHSTRRRDRHPSAGMYFLAPCPCIVMRKPVRFLYARSASDAVVTPSKSLVPERSLPSARQKRLKGPKYRATLTSMSCCLVQYHVAWSAASSSLAALVRSARGRSAWGRAAWGQAALGQASWIREARGRAALGRTARRQAAVNRAARRQAVQGSSFPFATITTK